MTLYTAMKRVKIHELQAAVEQFNRYHQPGDTVRVWTGPREGEGRLVQTVAAAFILGGHTPVVYVTGGHGCVALTHVA